MNSSLLIDGDENGGGLENNHIAVNPGDYIVGNLNMERFLTRLFEKEAEDHRAPPMEPEDIENIETTMLAQEVLDKSSTWPICLDWTPSS